ncbi:hypothetical protein F5Y17DRAFT_88934 [Xylariaceae sp. FL0594]|nr:hypothetical protein F5Y17DRAFT_88934 [Xylariaceae sp. FL0594]
MSLLSVFAPFPRLPTEIRHLIWAHALPRGRIQLFARNVPWEDWRLSPPLIAQVCRESRQVARDFAVVRGFPTSDDKDTETWFLWCRDILELASGYPYPLSNPEPFFASARALAINAGDFDGEFRLLVRDLIRCTRFHSVKVVYLIVEQIHTAYWPRFRPDVTEQDKGKGTILDLCDGEDLRNIEEYKAWARSQEMSAVFPRLEEVEMSLRRSLEDVVTAELNTYRRSTTSEVRNTDTGELVQDTGSDSARNDPWVRQQCQSLPDFRPALLLLGWK